MLHFWLQRSLGTWVRPLCSEIAPSAKSHTSGTSAVGAGSSGAVPTHPPPLPAQEAAGALLPPGGVSSGPEESGRCRVTTGRPLGAPGRGQVVWERPESRWRQKTEEGRPGQGGQENEGEAETNTGIERQTDQKWERDRDRENSRRKTECRVGERRAEEGQSRLGWPVRWPGPRSAGAGMAGRGVARGPGLRLRECQHGCKEHLGNTISFFFRFISGNLARGERCFSRTGVEGGERGRFGAQNCACLEWGRGDQGGSGSESKTGRDPQARSPAL